MFQRILTLMLLAGAAVSAGQPIVGDKAPDFALRSVDGSTIRLSERNAEGPMVLVVLRGYPGYQCPFCNRQAQDFIQKSAAFAAAGARVVMVYPGPAQEVDKRAMEFLADKAMPANFDLLLDPGYEMAAQYGIRWDAPKETAYPSTFLIDRSGVVFFSKIVKSHGGRTTAAEVLDALPKPRMKPTQ